MLNWLERYNNLSLVGSVILFAYFLKNQGYKVFSSNIVDSLICLEQIDISSKEDFFSALRANLAASDIEWKRFRELFEEFWQGIDSIQDKQEDRRGSRERDCEKDLIPDYFREMALFHEKGWKDASQKDPTGEKTYSPIASLERKDLAQVQREDIKTAQHILRDMISPFRITETRRFKKSNKPGDIDFRRLMRKSLKTDGIPLALSYRRKKMRLRRLVFLVDVSGSMDCYVRFVMPFILGLKGVRTKAEVFVFSTSLTSISPALRRLPLDEALKRISTEVPDWSGGTRIGYSLCQFNQRYGERLLNKRTVLAILSDGWDLGGNNLLRREMETLSRKAYCIIWLNPLAGHSEYKPVCSGMQTALPFVDYFLAADSLQSLRKAGRILSRIMIH